MIGETKTVTLTLRINPNPTPGTYHAFIGFGYGDNRDRAEEQVARGDAPGTVVSVSFANKKTTLIKLSRFIIDRFILHSSNQAAIYTIKNPGEEAVTPAGEIIFYDKRGVEVAALPVNADKISVPPGGEQEFAAEVPTKDLFGKYKAFLSVEYGSQHLASVQDTTYFYVFPLKIILPVFFSIIILVGLAALLMHKRYYSEVDDDGSEPLFVHVREVQREAKPHDIDLSKKE